MGIINNLAFSLSYAVLSINILVIAYFLVKSFPSIRRLTARVDRGYVILVLMLFIFSFLVRSSMIPHRHIMYIDESQNIEAAKNFIRMGKPLLCTYETVDNVECGRYLKPLGFPYLLSWFLLVFGLKEQVAISVSILFGSLSSILIFYVAYYLSGREDVGLLSSLMLMLMPGHILWSGTSETNIVSLFFNLAAIFILLVYLELKDWNVYFLTIGVYAFAIQITPVDWLLIPLAIVAVISLKKGGVVDIRDSRFLIGITIALLLTLPNLLQISRTVMETTQYYCGMDGCHDSILSIRTLVENMRVWGPANFMKVMQIPTWLSIFIIVGLICLRKNMTVASFLTIWFLCFYIVNLSYWHPQDRKLLNAMPPLIIICSRGIGCVMDFIDGKNKLGRKITLSMFCLIIAIAFYPQVLKVMSDDGYYAQSLETKIPDLVDKVVPESCYLISVQPSVFLSTTDVRGMALEDVMENPGIVKELMDRGDCVYFLRDIYCELPVHPLSVQHCDKFILEYNIRPYSTIHNQMFEYSIYEVTSSVRTV